MMHTAQSYKAEWATLTGKSEREIYVPVALRDSRRAPAQEEPAVLAPVVCCSECGDEFDPIEGQVPSDEPADQSNFCSDDCYDRYHDKIDAQEAYDQAGWSAPVF